MEHENLHILNISKEAYGRLLTIARHKPEAILLCERLLGCHAIYNPANSEKCQRFFDMLRTTGVSQDSEENARHNWRESDPIMRLERLGITGKKIPELFRACGSEIDKMYISLLTDAASDAMERTRKPVWWKSLLRKGPRGREADERTK